MRFSSLSLTTAFLVGAALPAAAATLSVPSKAYPTIQKAVSAAKPGDTVLVTAKPKGAVYNEAVTITTPNIILQGSGNPIIDGTGLGVTTQPYPGLPPITTYPNGIDIRASHVAVRGLTVQNTGGDRLGGGSGINAGYLTPDYSNAGFSDIEISSVTARNNYAGITLRGYADQITPNGGTTVSSKGYRLLGDVVTGSTQDGMDMVGVSGALISGCRFTGNGQAGLSVGTRYYSPSATENVLIAGNSFTGNYYDGLDTNGDGLTVTANEAATNGYAGINSTTPVYNPALASAQTPNPPASAVSFNSVHDNGYNGLVVSGTQTVSANLISKNLGYGLFLSVADYSTVSYNLITGTQLSGGYNSFDGTGLYADSTFNFDTNANGGFLTISGNVISGSASDGLYLAAVTGSTVSRNDVSGNAGVGIHLSDFPYLDDAPNTVTLNRALRNTLFDARDDSTAVANLTYPDGEVSYADNGTYGPTLNIWTKNTFGTTDPVNLSK